MASYFSSARQHGTLGGASERKAVGKLTGQGRRLHHVETKGGPGIKGCVGGAVRQDGAPNISNLAI